MKIKSIVAGLVLGSAFSGMAFAQTAVPNTQQSKMTQCNQQAAGKKGDERKGFMKECLSAKKTTPQERMKMCNQEATGKKGDERKAFMKSCLSTSAG